MPNLIIQEQTPFEDVNPFHEGCFITLFHIPTQNASFTRDSSASLLLEKGDYKTRLFQYDDDDKMDSMSLLSCLFGVNVTLCPVKIKVNVNDLLKNVSG